MRVECEGGVAAWLVGTLAAPTVQGHSASAPGVMALSESFFKPVVAGNQSFSIAPPFQHLEGSSAWGPSLLFSSSDNRRANLTGVLLCSSLHQVFDA